MRHTGPKPTVVPMREPYEARPLAKPDEELVDQGLAFDVGTLLNRRRALRFLGIGAAGAVGAACSAEPAGSSAATSATTTTTAAGGEIPDEPAGPYPGDGSNGPDVLEQSGIVRGDIRSSLGTGSATAEGVPMTLELTIADLANGGRAFAGVGVFVWEWGRGGQE